MLGFKTIFFFNNMFYRNIIQELDEWSSRPDRKPLVLRGARQVGKTTVVTYFAKKYSCFIQLNLEKREHRILFESSKPFSEKLDAIFFAAQKIRSSLPTLLFIDEIQNSPEAVALMRYFYEEAPEIHVIAAGSLLESLIGKHISFPVGRVEYLALRPCSFREFLMATSNQLSLDVMDNWPVPDYAHPQLSSLFQRYALIGGMPAVVANYARYNDLVRLKVDFQALVAGYIDDVEKYARNNSSVQHIRHILRTGFNYCCQRIKYERFGESDYRSREMSEAFQILEKTMLIELVFPSTSAQIPILPNYKKSPRLHWLDTGLANFMAGVQLEVFSTDIQSAWNGVVAEHIVGQELIVDDFSVLTHRSFWVREAKNSNAEVDYLLSYQGLLLPIEVKSGAGSTLKSLHLYMDLANHDLAIRVWNQPFQMDYLHTSAGKKFRLISIPFYMVSQIIKIVGYYI